MNILGDKMNKKGWKINMIQNPNGFHFCVTHYHTKEIINEFITDLQNIIPEIPEGLSKSKCIYGTMKSVNDGEIIKDVICDYLHMTQGYQKKIELLKINCSIQKTLHKKK